VLDVVVPVHNEELELAGSVARLHRHLSRLPYSFRITVADNASTDGTALVAHRAQCGFKAIRRDVARELLPLGRVGKGVILPR
jgi:glycosyltransferase involved in cell wall biosynthesis